jgi:oligopeptide transport system permease protein
MDANSTTLTAEKGTSLWKDAWIKLRKNRLALIGLGLLVFLCVISLLTPWIAPYGYEEQNLLMGATPPSAEHWLGTDVFGRDMLTRIMWGGRVSLMVGFIATAVALAIGVIYGAVAGYVGGRVDAVMMRLVDILYALPFMIFIILLMVVFGRNLLLLFFAIGAVEWLTMARIVRGQVMSLRKQEFVEAGPFSGPVSVDYYSPPYYSQHAGAGDCLHHSDDSQRDVAGGLSELPGAGHPASAKLLGPVD